jgi:hypothetical protein
MTSAVIRIHPHDFAGGSRGGEDVGGGVGKNATETPLPSGQRPSYRRGARGGCPSEAVACDEAISTPERSDSGCANGADSGHPVGLDPNRTTGPDSGRSAETDSDRPTGPDTPARAAALALHRRIQDAVLVERQALDGSVVWRRGPGEPLGMVVSILGDRAGLEHTHLDDFEGPAGNWPLIEGYWGRIDPPRGFDPLAPRPATAPTPARADSTHVCRPKLLRERDPHGSASARIGDERSVAPGWMAKNIPLQTGSSRGRSSPRRAMCPGREGLEPARAQPRRIARSKSSARALPRHIT